jgi:O-antigen/teichoic acid export membrane protein
MSRFGKVLLLDAYDRNRRLANNLVGTYVVKGGSVVVSLLTMPAYMRYFADHTVLGVWFVLIAILQWVLTFDFGIGNGLRNLLVPVLATRNWARAQRFVSSAYALVGGLALALLVVGAVIVPRLDWTRLLGLGEGVVPPTVLAWSAAILFGGIVFQFFLRLVSSILLALERTALSNLLSLASSILILVFVSVYPAGDVGESLLTLTVANVVCINLPLAVATVVVFRTSLSDAGPRLSAMDRGDAWTVLRLGGKFFWIQLMLLVSSGTNEVLIAYWYGSGDVVEYQVYYRLFFLLVALFALVANPIWSAVAARSATGDLRSARSVLSGTLLIAILMASLNLLLLPFGQWVLDLWLHENSFRLDLWRSIAMIAFAAVTMSNMAVSAIANGLGLLRSQVWWFAAAALLKLPVSALFAGVFEDWLAVVLANALVLLPYTIAQLVVLKRFFSRAEGEVAEV